MATYGITDPGWPQPDPSQTTLYGGANQNVYASPNPPLYGGIGYTGSTGPNTLNEQTGVGYDINGQPGVYSGYADIWGNKIYHNPGNGMSMGGGTDFVPFPVNGGTNPDPGTFSTPPNYLRIDDPGAPSPPPSQPPLTQTINLTVPQQQQQRPGMPAPNPLSMPTGQYSGMPNAPLPNVPNNSPLGGPGSSSPAPISSGGGGNTQPSLPGGAGAGGAPRGGPLVGGQQQSGGNQQGNVSGGPNPFMMMPNSPSPNPQSSAAGGGGGGPWSQAVPQGASMPGGPMPMGPGGGRPMLQGRVSQNVYSNGAPIGGGPGGPSGAPQGGGMPGGTQPMGPGVQPTGENPIFQAARAVSNAAGQALGGAAQAVGNWLTPPAEAANGMVPPPPPTQPPAQIAEMAYGQAVGAKLVSDDDINKIAQAVKSIRANYKDFTKKLDISLSLSDAAVDKRYKPLATQRLDAVKSWTDEKSEKARYMQQQLTDMRGLQEDIDNILRGPVAHIVEEGAGGEGTGAVGYDVEAIANAMDKRQNQGRGGQNFLRDMMHPTRNFEQEQHAANVGAVEKFRDKALERRNTQLGMLSKSLQMHKEIYNELQASKNADLKAYSDLINDWSTQKMNARASILNAANTAITEQGTKDSQENMALGRYLQAKEIESIQGFRDEQMKANAHSQAIQDALATMQGTMNMYNILKDRQNFQAQQAKQQQDQAQNFIKMFMDAYKAGISSKQMSPDEAMTNAEAAARQATGMIRKPPELVATPGKL